MKKNTLGVFLVLVLLALSSQSAQAADPAPNGIPDLAEIIRKAAESATPENPAVAAIPKGEYHFYADQCEKKELYISNGLQQNPRNIGLSFDNLKNVIIDFQGSELLCHGQVLTLVMRNCENCTIRNCVIDSPSPLMQQIEITKSGDNGITFKPEDWVRCSIEKGTVVFDSDQWRATVTGGMAFNKANKHVLHNVPGVEAIFKGVQKNEDGTFFCPNWKDKRLVPGTAVVLRPFIFPPAIFLCNNRDTTLENIKIHYGHSKAITVQLCENVHFNGVSVCLRDPKGPRCFTANADSTHFSCCKGKIIVENGIFENAMDDAINVHGIYTKVVKRINDKTIQVQFMGQGSWGYQWAQKGDVIQFIQSKTMDHYEGRFTIVEAKSVDKPDFFGEKVIELTVAESLPDFVAANANCGVENTAWNPDVVFRNNIMRNNRARGTLFSSCGSILVENNLFDHVSGTAILLCGDCNFWYESGPCRNMIIRNNRFVNCMGAFYQYCNAIISIFPEVPDFAKQRKFYYGGHEDAITIENNEFDTFDTPILYARSIDGLTFRKNKIRHNQDFPKISSIKVPFTLEKADRIRIYDNEFDVPFNPAKDIVCKRTPLGGLQTDATTPFGPAKGAANTRTNRFFAYRSFNKEPETTRQFAEIGVTTRCFYAAHTVNSLAKSYCEYPPIWIGEQRYDWSAYDAQVTDLLAAHPEERLICMIDLNSPYWAIRRLNYDSFGSITRAACDPLWYSLTTKWLEDFLRYSEEHYGDKIDAYVLAAGGTSEWYEYDRGESSRTLNLGWAKWCKNHNLDFGPATPPETTLHKAAFENTIFDPAVEPEKPAFWQFHCEVIVDAMLHYAQIARELVPNKSLGYFFGYFLVSDPRPFSFGHLDYERIYASPDIDFFISPGNYRDRMMGGGSGPQLVQGTLGLCNKHYFHEIDHGTHVSPDWKVWNTQEEDEAGLKREIAYAIVNHGSLWIFDMWGRRFTVEKTRNLIGELKIMSERFKDDQSKSVAPVLMLVDPQSAYYTNEAGPTAFSLAQGIQNKLNRLGTAYDIYSFNDIPRLNMDQYKAVILAGTFLITPEREALLKQYVCNNDRAVFWCYAPGICDGKTLNVERVAKWSGVPRETKGVSSTDMGGWTSVYARNYSDLTPTVFRGHMAKAGVHFYVDEEIPVYANERLLMIHCKNGGPKKVSLLGTYSKVIELFSGKTVGENVKEFTWDFASPDTVLFELIK